MEWNCRLELRQRKEDGAGGHTISLTLQIENTSAERKEETFCLQTPLEARPFGLREIEIKLGPGEHLELPMEFTFSCGGCHLFLGWVKGMQERYLWKWPVRLGGAGWYSGDTHTHSTYSDGKGSIRENRESMMEKGHSFLYSTDHNTLKQAEEIESFGESDRAMGFLHLAGWEFTTPYGHALSYGTKHPQDPSKISERGKTEEWQSFVDERNQEGGIVFLAHPYEAPRYEFGEPVLDEIRGIAGIEVWNGYNHHGLAYQNRKAFARWDELNVSRNLHLTGNAVSDAHTAGKQGDPYIKGYLNTLNRDSIHEMLKSGRFFGSNGPEIRFSIQGAGLGETCRIGGKTLVHGRLVVFDPLGRLEEVILYRGMRQDKRDVPARKKIQKVLDVFSMGDGRTIWMKDWYFYAEPGDFYRVEAVSEQNLAGILGEKRVEEKGFAYTNPIWIEGEEQS